MATHSEKIRKVAKLTPAQRQERRRKMIEMRNAGSTLEQIGDHFGISREAVRLQLKKGDEVREWGTPGHKEKNRDVA